MVDFRALTPWRSNKAQPPVVREDVFEPFVTFRREMERMFENFFEGFPIRSGNGSGAIAPALDLDETDKELVVTAELPGVTDKDVEVNADDSRDVRAQAHTPRGRALLEELERQLAAASGPAAASD